VFGPGAGVGETAVTACAGGLSGCGAYTRFMPAPSSDRPPPDSTATTSTPEDRPAAMLAARRRHQRHRGLAMTPQERLAAMEVLIRRAWDLLQANPAALAHFRRRNHRKRSIPAAECSPHGT